MPIVDATAAHVWCCKLCEWMLGAHRQRLETSRDGMLADLCRHGAPVFTARCGRRMRSHEIASPTADDFGLRLRAATCHTTFAKHGLRFGPRGARGDDGSVWRRKPALVRPLALKSADAKRVASAMAGALRENLRIPSSPRTVLVHARTAAHAGRVRFDACARPLAAKLRTRPSHRSVLKNECLRGLVADRRMMCVCV